jgi:hypothetical protein
MIASIKDAQPMFIVTLYMPIDEEWEKRDERARIIVGDKPYACVTDRNQRVIQWLIEEIGDARNIVACLNKIPKITASYREK